ncbi:MAG: VWA domain-containing protein [Flavobacteriaceae bacterium]|nr:VWA domain-containing protein [Flavobacteriaceae bacterium]
MIFWDKPYYFFVLLLAALLAYLFWNLHHWRQKARYNFADTHLQQDVFRSKMSNWINAKVIYLMISLLFIVLTLMGPLWGEEEQKLKREGIDIIFALDLSNSMNAQDIAPSRLEKSKFFISDYLNRLGGDRVGLVVFAGDAYAVSPLTADYAALVSFIENLDTHLLWDQGTNFAAALRRCSEVLGDVPDTSKAVILISDGEDHEKGLDDAIELLRKQRIEVFAVGVGKDVPVPIPMDTADGWDDGYKTDDNGSTVLTSFHGQTLRSIADRTNGKYIQLERIEDGINSLKDGIDALEKKSQTEISTYNKKQQFQWFLLPALLFFLMYSLTPENKKIKQ